MKRLTGTTLLSLVSIWIVGCSPIPPTPSQLSATTVSSRSKPDLELPEVDPQFSSLDFSLAQYDPESSRVYLLKQLFNFENRAREEQATVMQEIEITREQVNQDGTTETIVERQKVPRIETREVTYTECVWVGAQEFSCPLSGVVVFDSTGRQLSESQVVAAFQQEHRVVLQEPGSVEHAYYRAFLHPDVLFIQSKQWSAEDLPNLGSERTNDVAAIPPTPVID